MKTLHISVSNAVDLEGAKRSIAHIINHINNVTITADFPNDFDAERLKNAHALLIIGPGDNIVGRGQYNAISAALDNNIPVYSYDNDLSPFRIISIERYSSDWKQYGKVKYSDYIDMSDLDYADKSIKERVYHSTFDSKIGEIENIFNIVKKPVAETYQTKDPVKKAVQIETRSSVILALCYKKRKKK